MPADIDRELAAGFAYYLTKPIDIGQFNESIDAVLSARMRTTP
jgi:CheY-like chemotaxis protein